MGAAPAAGRRRQSRQNLHTYSSRPPQTYQQDACRDVAGSRLLSQARLVQARLAGSTPDAMAMAFLAPWASAYRVHTVFCAECTNNFDYKSIAAFWSHNVSGMPGGITRCALTHADTCARYTACTASRLAVACWQAPGVRR